MTKDKKRKIYVIASVVLALGATILSVSFGFKHEWSAMLGWGFGAIYAWANLPIDIEVNVA